MDIIVVINQMCILFLLIFTGYIANKKGIINAQASQRMSSLIVNITSPALIMASVLGHDSAGDMKGMFYVLLIAIISYIVLPILSLGIPKLLNIEKKNQGLYQFMTIFSNVGFMGIPVIYSIYGSQAVFYVAIFNLPFSILVYSLGIYLVAKDSGSIKKFNKKKLLNMGVISAIITMLLFALQIELPIVLTKYIESLGSITTPLSMIVIGSSLAAIPIKEVFAEKKLYIFSFIKLLVVPGLIYLLFKPFVSDPVILGVTVIISGMPVATTSVLLCNEFGGNEDLAAKGVFLSTVASICTIPLLAWLLFL